MNWYFEVVDDTVHLDTRLEDGEMLGDAHAEVGKGQEFYGVSYDAMREVGGGVIVVDEGGIGHLITVENDDA